jgi:hypothetical protein
MLVPEVSDLLSQPEHKDRKDVVLFGIEVNIIVAFPPALANPAARHMSAYNKQPWICLNKASTFTSLQMQCRLARQPTGF